MSVPRPAERGSEGFTLPELLITTLIIGIVTLVLFGVTESLTRTTASTQSRSLTLADSRTALERIARDLRAANPIDPLASGPTSQYDKAIAFKTYCSGGPSCSGGLRQVRYAVAGSTLSQTVGALAGPLLAPSGTPTLATNLRRGAVVNTAAQPVFTYYRRDGTVIATSPTVGVGIPSTYFRDCTKKVKVQLFVRSQANKADKVTELATTVTLRNHNEVNPC